MDHGTDGTILHIIAERAEQCKVAFACCAASPALLGQAWIRSAQGDFNLWCASIKATSTSKSSLDYRLRRREDVREPICDLLQGLVVALKKCQQLAGGKFMQTYSPIRDLLFTSTQLNWRPTLTWHIMKSKPNPKIQVSTAR